MNYHGPGLVALKPCLKLLFAWVIFYLALILYGKSFFYRDPGSIFYDPNRAFVRYYTDIRSRQAADFISNETVAAEKVPSDVIVKTGHNPTICVHFTTVKREGEQYIDHAIASALEGLTPEERNDIYVSVLFANTDPQVHPSYNASWLHRVVDEVYPVAANDPDLLSRLQKYERIGDYRAKGVADYVYGLNHCYDKGTPYVLMLEGDVIVANGWLVKTLHALEQTRMLQKTPLDWIYLRLFNQERSTGWASTEIGENHELFISLAIIVAVLCAVAVIRPRTKSSVPFTDKWSLSLICMLIIPSLVVMFFQAGKANLLPPWPGVHEENFGCCSQALVYPREQVQSLAKYLSSRKRGQVDLMINTHAREEGLSRFSLYPVQVQHVGIHSSRNSDKDEAQSVWSMAFEDKDPAALERQHQRLVGDIYHGNGRYDGKHMASHFWI